MPAFEKEILSPCSDKIKLLKWKVRKGTIVYKGSVLALYSAIKDEGNAPVCKLKAEQDGTISQLIVEEGEAVDAKGPVLKIHEAGSDDVCSHPTIMKDMCADCGADLRIENGMAGDRKKSVTASVAMVHSIPELVVSQEQALELGKEDENLLLRQKKLVLLVDLDQTLIHTTNDQIPSNLKGVKHFQLWDGRGYMWYHTCFRPFTEKFLEAVSKMYELHICTFGVRMYAHTIARLLDPENKYFSHRILSRDECFDNLSKTANLKALFPCGDKMVGIIDDREDVWNFAPNLIHVKAYRFFQGTADINAPPGLTKSEHDNEPIVHKTVTADDKNETSSKENTEKSTTKTTESEMDMSTVVEAADEIKSETVSSDDKDEKGNEIKENKDESMELSKEMSSEMESKDSDKMDDSSGDKNGKIPNPVTGDAKSDATVITDNSESDKTKNADPVDAEKISEKVKTTEDEKASEKCEGAIGGDGESDKDKDVKKGIEEGKEDKEGTTGEVEWEDTDDYLLHLEEILTRIHKAYYNMYEQSVKGGSNQLPDLKNIIPYVKKKVLKGANIVFSGMFPVNMPPERSKVYIAAKSLGANVQADIIPNKSKNSFSPGATTHLVAAKAGTVKYKSALKAKGVHVVGGDWLWACHERWEWVPEQLFLLSNKKDEANDDGSSTPKMKEKQKVKKGGGKRKRKSAASGINDADDSVLDDDNDGSEQSDGNESPPVKKKAKKSKNKQKAVGKEKDGRFASSYNPLLSFSNEDIEFMDKEVDEMMAEGDDSDESEEERSERIRKRVLGNSSDSDSDSDSLAGDFPRGWKMRRKSLSPQHKNPCFEEGGAANTDQEVNDEESENELDKYQNTVEAFATRESDQESSASVDSIGSADEEIAAAVEKEFLGSL